MRRILSLIAVVALMVAFAMPVVTADAASHMEKNPCNPCAAKKAMKKGEEAGEKGMDKMKKANPCNPCAAKAEEMKKEMEKEHKK